MLTKYCKQLDPKLVLEWGTGKSTQLILENTRGALIYTLEHEADWFCKWRKEFKDFPNHIKMYLFQIRKDYISFPLSLDLKFDLIFVDGRDRVKCLYVAKQVLADDGVVLLHDSERKEYLDGINLFRTIDENHGTVALKNVVLDDNF